MALTDDNSVGGSPDGSHATTPAAPPPRASGLTFPNARRMGASASVPAMPTAAKAAAPAPAPTAPAPTAPQRKSERNGAAKAAPQAAGGSASAPHLPTLPCSNLKEVREQLMNFVLTHPRAEQKMGPRGPSAARAATIEWRHRNLEQRPADLASCQRPDWWRVPTRAPLPAPMPCA